MLEIDVIDDPAAAEATLNPVRARLLAELAEPASASMLATRIGLPRQQVNYHLRTLEGHRLVELVEERRKGNVTERILRATAGSYVISPQALLALAPDASRNIDQLSANWLLALGARLVRDAGTLLRGAARAEKPLATFAIDSELRFASAADRASFALELSRAIADLVVRYDHPEAKKGRPHRLLVALHPTVINEAVTNQAVTNQAVTNQGTARQVRPKNNKGEINV